MLLADRIHSALFLLEDISLCLKGINPITRRMYVTGLINELYQISSQLTIINERMDTSLSFEDACLSLSLLGEKRFGTQSVFNEKLYHEEESNDTDINRLIDILPQNDEDYTFTSENADRFKTGMRYLSSDANLSPRNIVYALNKGISSIISMLQKIQQKKNKIKDYQLEDFWYEFLMRDDDLFFERSISDYETWKEEHDWKDLQTLKDKRTQEILKMLKSGVFKYDVLPVKRDISNINLIVSEDALEDGTEITDDLKTECARFLKYVSYKEDILCLDYVKLGKYVYKHYYDMKEEEGDSLIYFENMLLHIHNDMAECEPKLKKYLKFNEDDELEIILNNALSVIDSCKELLKDGVPQDFLTNYLKEAFYGETKREVQEKLKGQSKYTIICNMLGILKTTLKVFRVDTTSPDLASLAAPVVKEQNEGSKKKYPNKDSLKRYIDEGATDNLSKLSQWTKKYVTEKLGTKSEQLFLKISQ